MQLLKINEGLQHAEDAHMAVTGVDESDIERYLRNESEAFDSCMSRFQKPVLNDYQRFKNLIAKSPEPVVLGYVKHLAASNNDIT